MITRRQYYATEKGERKMADKITAIMPVYNEAQALVKVIEKLKTILNHEQLEHEIIVVNDGSTDKTHELLLNISGIKVFSHPTNLGYGLALKTGISHAKGNWILIIDADGSYDAADTPKLLAERNNYSMVVGLRKGWGNYEFFFKRPAKWFLNKIASYLAGTHIPDLNSGLRLFKKELALKFWHLLPKQFSFTTTLTMCFLESGYPIKYVPVQYAKRIGKSKISPYHFLGFLNLLIRLVIFFQPLKIFGPVSFFIFLLGIFFAFYSFLFLHKLMDVTVEILFISSLQIFCFGLLAELIVKRSR